MKKIISIIALLSLCISAYSQTSPSSYQNLKFDFENYSAAILDNNDKAIKNLLYPDIFTSLKEKYPNEFNSGFIDQFLQSMVGTFEETEKMGFVADIRNDGDIIQILDLSVKEIWLNKY